MNYKCFLFAYGVFSLIDASEITFYQPYFTERWEMQCPVESLFFCSDNSDSYQFPVYKYYVKEREFTDAKKIIDLVEQDKFFSIDLSVRCKKSFFNISSVIVPIEDLVKQSNLKILILRFLKKDGCISEKIKDQSYKLMNRLGEEVSNEDIGKIIIPIS